MKTIFRMSALAFAIALASPTASDAAGPGAPRATPEATTDVEFFAMPPGPLGNLPFSEAVRAGNMLYLSGELGVDASGKLVSGGIEAETRQMMDNIGRKLVRHGSSFDHVVQCTVALADMKEWPAFNAIYRTYFEKNFPARMAFGATGLALDARIELQCTAVVKRGIRD
jgi:2-iminobutanoate/2-iminopropanoate deaminase